MLSQVYYLVRSKVDGSYLAAHPKRRAERGQAQEGADQGYLLIFREHFDALSYLNTYAREVADRFAVESLPGTQLKSVLSRWGFTGVAVVQDPLIPTIEFLVLE